MRVDLQAPVAAETIAWEGIRPCTTVVVKATFRLDGNKLVFAEPRPISDDQTSRQGALRYPSDRVPWKAHPEILLVGHAKAVAPSSCIAASLQFGSHLNKCFFAMSGVPTAWVPLREKYLRSDRQGSVAVRVGPKLASHPAWRERRLPPDINYSAFNSAPEDQRVSKLMPETLLVLEGLMAATNRLEVRLPSWQPRCLLSGSETVLSLVCDTLWFDVDEGVMQLVWRGLCPFQNEHATVIIGSDERLGVTVNIPPRVSVSEVRRKPRVGASTVDFVTGKGMRPQEALPFSNVVAKSNVVARTEAGSEAPSSAMEQLPASASGTGVFTLPTLGQGIKLGSMSGIGVKLGSNQTLPFDQSAQEVQAADKPVPQTTALNEDIPPEPRDTATIDAIVIVNKPGMFPDNENTSIGVALPPDSSAGDELPFKPGSDSPSPLIISPAAVGPSPSSGATAMYSLAALRRAALPFANSAQPPSAQPLLPVIPTTTAPASAPAIIPAAAPIVPLPPNDVLATNQSRKSLEKPPGSPTAPVRERAAALPVATVAMVKAALLDGVALKVALLEHKVAVHKWHLNERRLVVDLARAAERGDGQLAAELDAAILRAQSARSAAQPVMDEDSELDAYVAVVVELEEADDPREVLADLDMDAEQWQAQRRRWMRQTMRDPELAAKYRTKLKQQRCALRDLAAGMS